MDDLEQNSDDDAIQGELLTQPGEATEEVEAVVAGHICLDIIPTLTGDDISFAPGRLIEAGKAVMATGGPVSNTGLALHKLGVNTRLMGKLGDDLFGQATLQVIESFGHGLTSGMVIAPGEASSYSVIINLPKTDRIIIHAPNSNDTFGADDIRYAFLETSGLFHFGYPPLMARMYQDGGAELVDLFKRAKATGVTTSLDFSLPDPGSAASQVDWRQILSATLPYVDVFLPSVEEMLQVLQRPVFDKLSSKAGSTGLLDLVTPETVSEMGKTLLDMGAKVVGLKAGHRGLYLRTGTLEQLEHMGRAQPTQLLTWAERELWAPCFTTPVVGTTGAGDATIAGFLLGLMRGMTPVATLSAACAVGACSVEALDAVSAIKSWPETLERIAAGWSRLLLKSKHKKSPLDMAYAGWQWNERLEVWSGPNDSSYAIKKEL